ncbi:hypothetical protein C8R45DRAFT_1077691 [Mycena sanguinolenta]|nr:hypothetical protein C8R45DRAFT_1077691 [Mycena sanguinolenta]
MDKSNCARYLFFLRAMTDLRSIYLVCDPLPHERVRAVHGSSRTSGSEASAVAICHWSIIIPSQAAGSFDRYELFQDRGQIVVECCGGGRKIRYMRKTRGVGAVDDSDRHQQNVVDFGDHRPVGKTIKSHADIMGIIRGDEPTIKQIWDGEYNLVTNNCQNFVVQILKLIASESPPEYYNILLKEQGKVISKLWSYESRDPPAYVLCVPPQNRNNMWVATLGRGRKGLARSYRFKKGVTQQKIDNEQQDEFCPANIRVAQWYPFSETVVFLDVFDLDAGYSVISDKEGWHILSGRMLEVVSPHDLTITLKPENFIPASFHDRIVQFVPTIGVVTLMLLYFILFHTFFTPVHLIDFKSWATQPGILILGLLPSVGLYVLTFIRGIQYNEKHNIKSVCPVSPLLVHVWLLQHVMDIFPILRIAVALGCGLSPTSTSDLGTPVCIKRGTFALFGHWALVIGDREYHLVSEDGQPKLKDVLHQTAHLPDTHTSFSGKYLIGWSKFTQEELRKKFELIARGFGQYKFGGPDCRTFVAIASHEALDGQISILGPSTIIILVPLFCAHIQFRYPFRLFSLWWYGFADATLLHLSFHLTQTLIDASISSEQQQNGILNRANRDFAQSRCTSSTERRRLMQGTRTRSRALDLIPDAAANLCKGSAFAWSGACVYHKTDTTACFSTDYHCQDGCTEISYPGASTLNLDDGFNGQDWLLYSFVQFSWPGQKGVTPNFFSQMSGNLSQNGTSPFCILLAVPLSVWQNLGDTAENQNFEPKNGYVEVELGDGDLD